MPDRRPQLRPYQRQDCDSLARLLAAHQRVLYRLPTGGGKTIVAGALAIRFVQRFPGKTCWFLVHRRELVQQAWKTLSDFGYDAGIIAAGSPTTPWNRLQVASVQTLARRVDSERFRQEPNFIIVDEAHHVVANTYSKIINRFPSALVLGITATPQRLDGKGLADQFNVLHAGATEKQLVALGHLADPKVYVRETELQRVSRMVRGEYDISQQQGAAERSIAEALKAYQDHGTGSRAILYTVGVENSRRLAERFGDAGIPAAHIDGTTPTQLRDATLRRFAEGEIRVVCNDSILTEGFDCPAAEVVMLGRKTASLGMYLQMVGRVMRPGPNKRLLDLAGNVFEHGSPCLDREWSLDGAVRRRSGRAPAEMAEPGMWVCPAPCFVVNLGSNCMVCSKPRPDAVTRTLEERREKMIALEGETAGKPRKASAFAAAFKLYHSGEWTDEKISQIIRAGGFNPGFAKHLRRIVEAKATRRIA